MGTRLPIIGIVSNFRSKEQEYFVPSAYVDAVAGAGGQPLILPYGGSAAAILPLLDGILLTGGSDFSPELYGGRHHPAISEILENRDSFEIRLTESALETEKPILAICRGMQLVNVLRGGAIFDHTLDDRPRETRDHRDGTPLNEVVHEVIFTAGSKLAQICGVDRAKVNSMHHQAISRLGAGLVAAAYAPDGVVEAIEDPESRFLIGIQWHPERLQHDPANERIVSAFVSACENS